METVNDLFKISLLLNKNLHLDANNLIIYAKES